MNECLSEWWMNLLPMFGSLMVVSHLQDQVLSSYTQQQTYHDLALLLLPPWKYIISYPSQPQCSSFCPQVLSLCFNKTTFLHWRCLKNSFLSIHSQTPTFPISTAALPHELKWCSWKPSSSQGRCVLWICWELKSSLAMTVRPPKHPWPVPHY